MSLDIRGMSDIFTSRSKIKRVSFKWVACYEKELPVKKFIFCKDAAFINYFYVMVRHMKLLGIK
ncbi:hypothetical protein MspRI1_05570 [Marinobacter sp. RI1]